MAFPSPESIKLMNTMISQAPKGILSLIDATKASSKIQWADIITFLQEDIDIIKNDLSVLRLADFKTAKQNFTVGLEQLLKAVATEAEARTSTVSLGPVSISLPSQTNDAGAGSKNACWKDTLIRASDAANDAYNRVKAPEDKIECFWIICCCAIATDSPLDACIKIRNWIDYILNDDETIRKALEDLKKCTYVKNVKMTLETKELLSSLFKRLRGSLVALFYYYERNARTFGHEEKNKLIRVLRKLPYLYEATKQSSEWKHIKVYHCNTKIRTFADCTVVFPLAGRIFATTAQTVTFGRVKPQVPTDKTSTMELFDRKVLSSKRCGIILETGHFLNAIFYKNDFKLEADMIKWLPATQIEEGERCNFWMMRKITLPQYKSTEWYCSLFAASFAILGLSHYLLSSRYLSLKNSRASKRKGLFSDIITMLTNSSQEIIDIATLEVRDALPDRRKLSNSVKNILQDAATAASNTTEAANSLVEQMDA
mmetsp:Transcript_18043/g.27042  ORF Transcript_18043/g.27042 Transcript_18043/m.27042 type:complete len:485 (+) Transcript_18043:166-1620(+)|eukprot:CAMPEP_0203679018 /NCGR_PEP_ID=MMETSP0090-20130426/33989_1 /ASSEMBLY_ACC=CAM_ASM_001088 /TAXON_ID=426623 /ORGANISM="Chaetoceros affinis, Strain CCMP159" /LENGTH=484 /DNA_ID=CAMNT_0050546497 /DNA_START=169 /DNA_END=1623 /DNA_ORIENTATION=+